MRQFCNRRWSSIVRGIVVAVATTAVCGGAAVNASAQSQAIDGTIEGFTRGAKAEAMAGVKVQAVNTGTGYERNTVSDAAGRFSLSLLPPGAYVVIAAKDGFGTVSKENLDVKGGQVLTLEINLSST